MNGIENFTAASINYITIINYWGLNHKKNDSGYPKTFWQVIDERQTFTLNWFLLVIIQRKKEYIEMNCLCQCWLVVVIIIANNNLLIFIINEW